MLDKQQFQELLLQSLEHERGGVKVYETAVECAIAPDLKREWQKYLEQTRNHVRILERVLQKLEIDPEQPTPGREIVAALGASLVAAMQQAQGVGNPNAEASARGSLRDRRGRRGRAPLSQSRLLPRVVARFARPTGRAAAARGNAAREERDQRGPGAAAERTQSLSVVANLGTG